MKRVPDGVCSFENTRSYLECLGCPNINCMYVELPFQDLKHTEEVLTNVIREIEYGNVTVPDRYVDMSHAELVGNVFADLGIHIRRFKINQAVDAVKWKFASVSKAAKWAGVDVTTIRKEL